VKPERRWAEWQSDFECDLKACTLTEGEEKKKVTDLSFIEKYSEFKTGIIHHLELLGFWTLSIVRYSEKLESIPFQKLEVSVLW
jgi:hypothetical protein